MVAVDVTFRKGASFVGVGLHELLQHDGVVCDFSERGWITVETHSILIREAV